MITPLEINVKLPSFRDWYSWMKSSEWRLKWFILLILFKPVIDVFWFIKDSGYFSPAQIVGILTFIVSSYHVLFSKKPRWKEGIRLAFGLFSILLIFNALFLHFSVLSIRAIGEFVRMVTPIPLFLYLRSAIDSSRNLNGVLKTFVISSFFPLGMMIYEGVVGPIRFVAISEYRGGGYRLTGLYADLFNYMSYIIGDFIIITAVLVQRAKRSNSGVIIPFVLLMAITIFGLSGMKHQASWGVFTVILIIFLAFQLKTDSGRRILSIAILGGVFGLQILWNSTIAPLFSKEAAVVTGDLGQERALNGRVYRWTEYFGYWDEVGTLNKVFGVGFSSHQERFGMMSGGMHSDYIRFLFSTGIVGLLAFLWFYLQMVFSIRYYGGALKFLVLSVMVTFIMYGLTANPFGSSGALLYLGLTVMTMATRKTNRL